MVPGTISGHPVDRPPLKVQTRAIQSNKGHDIYA